MMHKVNCALCGALTDNGLTAIPACDAHRDTPERTIGVLAECAGALANLMEDLSSERNLHFAEIALGRLRADRFLGTQEPVPAHGAGGEGEAG